MPSNAFGSCDADGDVDVDVDAGVAVARVDAGDVMVVRV